MRFVGPSACHDPGDGWPRSLRPGNRNRAAAVIDRAQPSAYPRWYERLRAVAGIAVINVVIGVLIAAGVGALIFLVAFAVELAISS